MERRKRWLASLLALVLAVGLLPTAAWAEGCTENLECAADKHTLYCPKNEKNVTRAELAEIIYKNGEGAFQTVNSASTSPAGFSDIRSLKEAQKNAINALANADIIAGTELGTDGNPLFTPDTEVTREQVAVVFWRLTGSKQVPLTENLSFKDVSAVDPFAPAVAAMVSAGLASGMSDDSFGVGQQITVGQVNTLIGRYLGTVDGGTTQAKFDTYKSATTRLDMVREAYAKYKNSPLATVIAPELDYADIGTCSKDEQAMIQFFTTRGIAQGYAPKDENNPVYRFGPYDAVSNLQAAVFLYQCATKFESRSVEASGQLLDGEGDLTAQAISYALNQGGAGEMITAAWNFLEQETGLNLSDYKDNPDTAVLANTVSTWTERLVPERPTITVTNGQAAISTTETDAVIYYTTDGTTPTVESAKYTSEPSVSVPVTQGTTVKAVAVKNSLYSEVATYTAPVLTITPQPYLPHRRRHRDADSEQYSCRRDRSHRDLHQPSNYRRQRQRHRLDGYPAQRRRDLHLYRESRDRHRHLHRDGDPAQHQQFRQFQQFQQYHDLHGAQPRRLHHHDNHQQDHRHRDGDHPVSRRLPGGGGDEAGRHRNHHQYRCRRQSDQGGGKPGRLHGDCGGQRRRNRLCYHRGSGWPGNGGGCPSRQRGE